MEDKIKNKHAQTNIEGITQCIKNMLVVLSDTNTKHNLKIHEVEELYRNLDLIRAHIHSVRQLRVC